jgi:hypothetical protein
MRFWGGVEIMSRVLFLLAAASVFSATSANRSVAATFDSWSINSSSGFFDSGPTLTVIPGSNNLALSFTDTVFAPGSQIDGFNSGCNVGGCVSTFYYTLPFEIRLTSPVLSVTGGHNYAIGFDLNSSSFQSTANSHVETPYIELTASSNAILLVPPSTGAVSVNFSPSTSEDISFGFFIARGRNPNGVASSSDSIFFETGSYSFADFSVTDLSASVPEPSTWAMLLIGLAGIGFAAYRKRTLVTA